MAGVVGPTATATSLTNDSCRFTAGSAVAEVFFVSQADVRTDWFNRSGIEPVGEVGGDAVGLGSFLPPGGATSAGYTIALVGGEQGAVVAVTGTGDARLLAARIAIFADQAASG